MSSCSMTLSFVRLRLGTMEQGGSFLIFEFSPDDEVMTVHDQYHIKKSLNSFVNEQTHSIFAVVIKNIQKISAILLIPLLIFASGGLNIFSHYCHSHESGMYSILSSPECEHTDHSCCTHMNEGYCSSNDLDSPCCESHHKFIKTVEWNFVENPVEIEKPITQVKLINYEILEFPQLTKEVPLLYKFVNYSSPPDFSPKYISVLQQKLRLAC